MSTYDQHSPSQYASASEPVISSLITASPPSHECPVCPSIFHEPWWLDTATGGQWSAAKVMHGNQVLGELPYYTTRKGIWSISTLPPMTRTLGPVIKPMGLDAARELRHRLHVESKLIEQLPHFDSFFQLFDYHTNEALAFASHGFTVSARYTFQIPPACSASEVWMRMHSKTRNVIRGARKTLRVVPIDSPTEFLRFYELNLASRSRRNAYGSAVMNALVRAFIDRRAGCLLGAYHRDRLAGAVGLVWDSQTMYYLLSTRARDSGNGTISLLLWAAIQRAIDRKLTFDFDGLCGPSSVDFLSGFGGIPKQRLGVERHSTVYTLARTLKRKVTPKANLVFMPDL